MSEPTSETGYHYNSREARSYLPITVDKSHLVTNGERLYAESIELIRELVNNAYDADATEVKVTVTPESVSVQDNGTGMDMEGLQQYFVIGSQEKLQHPRSPVFKRDRIGQFGIGKFATLSACARFTVYTKKMILPRGLFSTRKNGHKKWVNGGFLWRSCRPIRKEPMERPSLSRA
jgi:Histidine kinase-, DNA gyrase B-, and HSP90-like ATPase